MRIRIWILVSLVFFILSIITATNTLSVEPKLSYFEIMAEGFAVGVWLNVLIDAIRKGIE